MAGALPFDADAVAYGLFTNLNQSQPISTVAAK